MQYLTLHGLSGFVRGAGEILTQAPGCSAGGCCNVHPTNLPNPPGHCKSWGASVHHTPTFCLFEANWSLLRGGQLWVLRSTLTLKTTDTTLVSVDGNIGHRGDLVPLPLASPDTITEETPSATVTLTQSHGRGKARPRS